MKKICVIGTVMAAIIVSIIVFSYYDNMSDSSMLSSDTSYGLSNSSNIEKNTNSDEPSYNGNIPEDFEKIRNQFITGTINIANLSREYYARPEFYPSYDTYKQSGQKRMGQIGYGSVISESSYNVYKFKTGQYINVYTFIRASYGVDSYQNLRLLLESPNDKLFETYIEPSNITLAPTYPEVNSSSDWIHKIKMTIVAKEDIPKGIYRFKLQINGAFVQPEKFFEFILYAYEQELNNKN